MFLSSFLEITIQSIFEDETTEQTMFGTMNVSELIWNSINCDTCTLIFLSQLSLSPGREAAPPIYELSEGNNG